MRRERLYVIDRLEGDHAVLVGDDGDTIRLARRELPAGAAEGEVLKVPLDEEDELDWGSANLDRDETRRRRAEAKRVLEELRRRDPGGDVEL